MKINNFIGILCCFFSLSPLLSKSSLYREEILKSHLDEINGEINKALKIFNVPGAAVGVIVDGKVILSKGYGCKNKWGLPVTENTLFGIGSCTKAFTTFVLGELVDEQLIRWDDLVIKYIPELCLWDEYTTNHTTIRDLLTHHTGLSGHDFLSFNTELTRKDLVKRLKYLEPIDGFRERFHYSNLMYALAGHVIERVTGKTWEETVKNRIFDPLGMKNSNFSLDETLDDFAENYFYLVKDGLLTPCPPLKITFIAPAYGINSSVSDMLKWIRLQLADGTFFEKKLINKNTLLEMHTPQIAALDSSLPPISLFNYGLGWRIGSYRDNYLVMHSGTRDGFQAQILMLPFEKIGIVILTNCTLIINHHLSREKYFISAISNMLLDKLLGCEKEDWIKKTSEIYEKNKLSQEKNEEKKQSINNPNLKDYIGIYQHPGYGSMQIDLKNNYLVASYGNIASPILCKEKDSFTGVDFAFSHKNFVFVRSPTGAVNELHISLEPSIKPIVFSRH